MCSPDRNLGAGGGSHRTLQLTLRVGSRGFKGTTRTFQGTRAGVKFRGTRVLATDSGGQVCQVHKFREAWFFGNQTDGRIDVKSRFRDNLQAEFDGTAVTGEVTMNEVEYDFTANAVSGLAGMYTAESDGVRASWVVRPDGSATGVQFGGFTQGDRNFDPFNLDEFSDFDVRNDVRPRRKLTPAGPIEFPQGGAPQSSINGTPVSPTLVTGTFRLG